MMRTRITHYLLAIAAIVFMHAAHAQRALTTPDLSSFAGIDSNLWHVIRIERLADGGALIFGRFEVWYEGKRFRDLLKLRPDGNPDTSWRVELTFRPGQMLNDVAVTPKGVFLLASAEFVNFTEPKPGILSVNGIAAPAFPYVSLATGELINADATSELELAANASLSRYDSLRNSVYILNFEFVDGTRVFEISAETGRLVAASPAMLPRTGLRLRYNDAIPDQTGGIWLDASTVIVEWPSPPEPPRSVRHNLPSSTVAQPLAIKDGRLVDVQGEFAYVGNLQLDKRTGNILATLASDRGVCVTRNNIYFEASSFAGLGRQSVTTYTVDRWTLPVPPGYAGNSGRTTCWTDEAGNDRVALLVSKANSMVDGVYLPSQAMLVEAEDSSDPPGRTVVEYYLPTLKRYFITGRKNEQDALDALPQSFQRTGMTFAAKSSRYRDIPEQPVCRMYFPPANGGSNTHFYGVGSDCATLNKLGGMKYEGYDFSVLKPAAGACPAAAPTAVTRLYNNKAATNESNHRYVVSEATKARMLAQGWVDEGPVFCSASVTDAAL